MDLRDQAVLQKNVVRLLSCYPARGLLWPSPGRHFVYASAIRVLLLLGVLVSMQIVLFMALAGQAFCLY